jgi:Na+-driven multidrug efflux pump
MLIQGILEGMGYTKKTFVWSSVSMWLFRVVICFAVTRLFAPRLEYAWLCMMGDNVFRALSLSLVFIRRKK